MTTPETATHCSNCSAELRPGVAFCARCGHPTGSAARPLAGEATRTAGPAGSPPPPPLPPPPPPPPPPPSGYQPAARPGPYFGDAPVDVHSGYRSMRLVHEPPDELASSQVTFRTLRPHLLRFVAFGAIQLVLFFFWAFCTAISAAGQVADTFSGQTSGGGFFGALSVLLGIAMFAVGLAWLVSLFLPVREPIAEYGVLLENRAAAAGQAFQWIGRTVHDRRSPLQIGDASATGRGLLTLENGTEKAAVIVTTYGVDLYLGWTMWRQRSTVRVLVAVVRDMVETLRGGAYAADVRLADTRAFRELVHSVTREGAQAAISAR